MKISIDNIATAVIGTVAAWALIRFVIEPNLATSTTTTTTTTA